MLLHDGVGVWYPSNFASLKFFWGSLGLWKHGVKKVTTRKSVAHVLAKERGAMVTVKPTTVVGMWSYQLFLH